MKVLMDCFFYAGTYDQVNGPTLLCLQVLARRAAQVVEAYSHDAEHPQWSMVEHYMGAGSPVDCINPSLRTYVAKKNKEDNE